MMKALRVRPSEAPEIIELENELGALQKEVGGYIEVVYPFDDSVGLVCNEEGKLIGLPFNRYVVFDGGWIDAIAGTFLVVGLSECDFTDLSDVQARRYYNLFS